MKTYKLKVSACLASLIAGGILITALVKIHHIQAQQICLPQEPVADLGLVTHMQTVVQLVKQGLDNGRAWSHIITDIQKIICAHKPYFMGLTPNHVGNKTVYIEQLLAALEQVKHETQIKKIQTTLKPYLAAFPPLTKAFAGYNDFRLLTLVTKCIRNKKQ